MKKPKRSKKPTNSSKRTKVAAKPKKGGTTVASTAAPAVSSLVTHSKAARARIAEGTRLFAHAGRPTKAQFVKVYGAKGPTMTW